MANAVRARPSVRHGNRGVIEDLKDLNLPADVDTDPELLELRRSFWPDDLFATLTAITPKDDATEQEWTAADKRRVQKEKNRVKQSTYKRKERNAPADGISRKDLVHVPVVNNATGIYCASQLLCSPVFGDALQNVLFDRSTSLGPRDQLLACPAWAFVSAATRSNPGPVTTSALGYLIWLKSDEEAAATDQKAADQLKATLMTQAKNLVSAIKNGHGIKGISKPPDWFASIVKTSIAVARGRYQEKGVNLGRRKKG